MPGETIEMTKRALHRLKVVEAVTEKRLTQTEAGRHAGQRSQPRGNPMPSAPVVGRYGQ